jgi:hypothetical protein
MKHPPNQGLNLLCGLKSLLLSLRVGQSPLSGYLSACFRQFLVNVLQGFKELQAISDRSFIV